MNNKAVSLCATVALSLASCSQSNSPSLNPAEQAYVSALDAEIKFQRENVDSVRAESTQHWRAKPVIEVPEAWKREQRELDDRCDKADKMLTEVELRKLEFLAKRK
jgi:hypothetical protein